MTLFTMLLVMIAERLFKLGEHWHLIIGWKYYSAGSSIFLCYARCL